MTQGGVKTALRFLINFLRRIFVNEKEINAVNGAIAMLSTAERKLSGLGEHLLARDCRQANAALVELFNKEANAPEQKPAGNKV